VSSILVALRRLRDDPAPAIGLALLVLATATLFGIAPRLIDRVADDALHGVVAAATPFNRNIALIQDQILPSDPDQPLRLIEQRGDNLDAQMPDPVAALVAQRVIVVDSARFEIQGKTPDPSFIRFRIEPGATDRIHYVAGVPPTATSRTIDLPENLRSLYPPEDPPSSAPIAVHILETSISSEAAHTIDRTVGDLVFLSLDSHDPLAGRTPGVVAARITGIFEVNDATDPFWYGDQSINHVTVRSPGDDEKLIDVGAVLPVEAYDGLIHSGQVLGMPIQLTWRHFIDPARISSANLDSLIVDLRRLETTFPQTQITAASTNETAMQSGLLPLIQTHQARWASASAVLTVVAIGPAAVAFAALALVASISARRRRPAILLVRGRGATLGQIVRAVVLEGCVIAIPALGLAILLSILLIPAGSNRATIIGASLVAAVAIGLLIATALPGTLSAARAARDDDASPRGVSARRLILDLVVIGLAATGAYLLRERGVRGASSTGTLTGADPLIAAVPALAGIAAGLAAIRLVPLPLRLMSRIAGRGRGLVPLLALRRAIHGGTTAAVLIVLLATASIGTFASAALVHLDRASAAASWQQIGAPIRIAAPVGPLPPAIDPGSKHPTTLPDVGSVAGLFRVQVPVGVRNVQVQFLAVDLAAYEQIVGGTVGDPGIPADMLAPTVPNGVVPVLVSQSLVDRTDGAVVGTPFQVVVEGYVFQALPIAARDLFPTLAPNALFVVASREQLRLVHPDVQLAASTLFVDGPDSSVATLRTLVNSMAPTATVDSRTSYAQAFTDSPVTAAIVVGVAIAALVAAFYAALAVAAALALAGAARANEVAHLRMIGLSRRDALGLVIVEHGPTVIFAFIAGVALGLGLFILLEPGLGLDAIVGSQIEVPLTTDPRQLAIILAGTLAIAAVGIGLAAWMQRRGVAVAALRRGFE
jgi:putative ABC transport system permease protein